MMMGSWMRIHRYAVRTGYLDGFISRAYIDTMLDGTSRTRMYFIARMWKLSTPLDLLHFYELPWSIEPFGLAGISGAPH